MYVEHHQNLYIQLLSEEVADFIFVKDLARNFIRQSKLINSFPRDEKYIVLSTTIVKKKKM